MKMESVGLLIRMCYGMLNYGINLFGYSVSLWQVLVFGMLLYFIVWLIWGILN